jgi:hypothetical protein
MAKITIKELESLTPNDAGRILREDGSLARRISARKDGVSVSFFLSLSLRRAEQRVRLRNLATQIPDRHPQGANQTRALIDEQINPNEQKKISIIMSIWLA